MKPAFRRLPFLVTALILSIATLIGGLQLTPIAQAAGKNDITVDGLTLQVKTNGEGEWTDLQPDENGIYQATVYDTLRFNMNWTVPQGSLSDTDRTRRIDIEGVGKISGSGDIIDNGTGRGTYTIDYSITNHGVIGYADLAFNDESVHANADLTLHGTLHFDQDGKNIKAGNHAIVIGGQNLKLHLKAPEYEVVKEPDLDKPTPDGHEYHWIVTITNVGDMVAPEGTKMELREYYGESNRYWNSTNLEQACEDAGLSIIESDSDYVAVDESGFRLNEPVTLRVTTRTNDDTPQVLNEFSCTSSSGDNANATASQTNPFHKADPDLTFTKQPGVSSDPGKMRWTVTVTNTGEGDMPAGWNLVDKISGPSWYTKDDLDGLVASLKKQGVDASVTEPEDITADGKYDSFTLTLNTVLPVGGSWTFDYTSSWDQQGDGGTVTNKIPKYCGMFTEGWKCVSIDGASGLHTVGMETLGKTWKNGYWNIEGYVTDADMDKDFVFHETFPESINRAVIEVPAGYYVATTVDIQFDAPIGERHEIDDGAYWVRTGERSFDFVFPAGFDWAEWNHFYGYLKDDADPNARRIRIGGLSYNLKTANWKDDMHGTATAILTNTVRGEAVNGHYDMTAQETHEHSVSYDMQYKNTHGNPVSSGARGSAQEYWVSLNRYGLDMNPDGDTVTIIDTVDVPDDASVSYVDGSLSVTSYDSITDSFGSSRKPSGPDERTLDPSSYTVSWNAATRTMTINGLPDGRAYFLTYKLHFNSVQDSVKYTNTVNFTNVDGRMQDAVKSSSVKILESGATVRINGVYVNKRDADDHDVLLAGASYRVDKWDGTTWVDAGVTLTTDANGSATFDGMECGRAYRLTETSAPDGYKLADEPVYVALKGCQAPVDNGKPADWNAGNDHIAMDVVDVFDERMDQVAALPTTGGPGMILWLFAAVPPILIAGLLRYRSRRLTGLHEA